ncbi:MAG: peptidoglycan DD-metalloendopeptidase family protein [Pseudomonadales bacterium]|jgi:septal ring factor EnvC (AmiA/AmiB activator)|nr:peptidoglycan DD-metalloendopeptidase family protein [Pseudomonadales bacterium]MDP6472584.1 peptidoglycan DD-metalloendopeptidase family protein [Pseudomonadales bacterium]MDP6829298.1 peptidoglycan DD-metalloendopeptidase family protein [Pseudomonadales bacterium]MDP6971838.1 peptidoglycan DD-metalloendopeptidase family protein [Pseudomonadales bacterium]
MASLLATPFVFAANATTDAREAATALKQVTRTLNALDAWLSEAEKRRVRWLTDLQEKDQEIAQVHLGVNEVETRLEQLGDELAILNSQQVELEARRLEQARRITEHLAASYRLSGQDFVKLIFNQGSPDTVDRMMRYHRYFSDARMQALESYQQTLTKLSANADLLHKRLTDQERERVLLARREAVLEEERAQRKTLIAALDSEAESKSAERTRLIADEKRLSSLVRELERRSRELDGSVFITRKGKLSWPVRGTVLHRFGSSRAGGRLQWSGTVFQAPSGTPVSAVSSGRVVFADWLRGFGLLTILDHGSGYMTLYGHSDTLTKRVGDWVESGEVIASAGQSGGQSSPGVYFEIRLDGETQNPHSWLTRG